MTMTGPVTALFAAAAGIVVVNLTACQPLVGLMAPALGLSAGEASLVSTVTMLGYTAGLFFLVPLTDIFENRRLIARTLVATVAALADH